LSGDVFNLPDEPGASGDIRAVFFDAGNTIAYLDVAWIAARLRQDGWEIDESAVVYGQNVAAYEASRIALLKRYPTDADRLIPYFSRILALAGIPADFTRDCAAILLEEHKANFLWRWVPDFVPATLRELGGRGYILGVVSNSDGRLKPLFDRTGLSPLFKCIIDSAVVGVEKPSPEIFHLAIEAAETEPERCLYVGDIYAVDIEGARRAGINGVLLDPMCLHDEFNCAKIAKLPDILGMLPPLEGFSGGKGPAAR
jgi:putative hydrolase of the HAD superfamily